MGNHASSVPELLAPAGDWLCAKAAVANGADAVYFGLDCGFNARARATSFALGDLPDLLTFLHQCGVRGYVTLNTLTFSDELPALEAIVRQIAGAGADAVLVQDLGLVQLCRRLAPDLAIHASTQMSLSSAEGIAVAERLGIERIVLARELSIDEIVQIGQQTSVPLEVFVHGALCISYSGQCLASQALGRRSANRGQCAQACRLPYELVCDRRTVELGNKKYLLSPQDLAAHDLVPELIEAGVAALKIEGRLKQAEYVASITRRYRQAIDAAVAGRPLCLTPDQVQEMAISFSRGFSTGWLRACDDKALVPATSSAKQGVLVGTVRGVSKGRVSVDLCGQLRAGDGIVFQGDRAAGIEAGGRVFAIYRDGRRITGIVTSGLVELTLHRAGHAKRRFWPGQQIWKNDDPALTRRWRHSFAGDIRGRERPLEIAVSAAIGESLCLEAQAKGLPTVACSSAEPLAPATRHPVTREFLEQQLGRLGGSGFVLVRLRATIAGAPMVPLSLLGKLRREMIDKLRAAREEACRTVPVEVMSEPVVPQLRNQIERPVNLPMPQLLGLCRSLPQLRTALTLDLPVVYVDFRDLRAYREAVELAHGCGAQIYLATPRMHKPGELDILQALIHQQADGILARNLASLDFFVRQGVPTVADSSLNAANELTVDCLHRQGAMRVTASYDLDDGQLLAMARRAPAATLEVVVYQHLPMFHTEHCVFSALLTPGTNKQNCGRPCARHEIRLRDRVGAEHLLTADIGCRNTLFQAEARSRARAVGQLLRAGVRHFRVELLLDDGAGQLRQHVDRFRKLLAREHGGLPDTPLSSQASARIADSEESGTTDEQVVPHRDS